MEREAIARPMDSAFKYASLPQGVTKQHLLKIQRQRMNINAMFTSFFVPWVLFCIVYAITSFDLHYHRPFLCWLLVALAGVVVLVVCLAAALSMRRKMSSDMDREPSWLLFVAVTMVLAYVCAIVYGNLNFSSTMRMFFDLSHLNTYQAVNPATMRGQQMMDAGKVYFVNNSMLDLRKAMGFQNLDTYCVAPITVLQDDSAVPHTSYDFWAVGLGCCSGSTADFHCGEYNRRGAAAGLRLMNDEQRDFYRLAVQQAEVAYNIKATHPLFFYWMADPASEMQSYNDEARRFYFIGMLAHFFFQLLCVTLATIAFSKMGQI
jgi:uncharacterized membrane protein YidH (DUF202 family)